MASVARRRPKVVAVSCPQRPVVDAFRAGGVLAFEDGSVALRSLACLARATARRAALARARDAEAPPPPPAPPPLPAGRTGGQFLNEWESQRLLAPYGLPLVDTVFVTAAAAAPDAAEQVGYPVVVKVCSSRPAPQVRRGRRRARAAGPRRGRGGLPAHRGRRARARRPASRSRAS